MSDFCATCAVHSYCKNAEVQCAAIKALYEIGNTQFTEEKAQLIREYAKALGIIEYEVSPELESMGTQVIDKMPELSIIKDLEVKVGYVLSQYPKRKDGKIICGECRKVTGVFTAFLPFDFIVTFYEPNIYYMTENQKKLLMLHELKHIGVGQKGIRVEPHDIEDFSSMLQRYGLRWNGFQVDVPDILAGGDNETEKTNSKKNVSKRQSVAT